MNVSGPMALMITFSRRLALLDGQVGQVIDVDRLQAVVAVAEHAEHRQIAASTRRCC